jgi:carbon starvation protein CstA
MLAGIALLLATTVQIELKRERYAFVTFAPTAWLLVCTLTAGWMKAFSSDVNIRASGSMRWPTSIARRLRPARCSLQPRALPRWSVWLSTTTYAALLQCCSLCWWWSWLSSRCEFRAFATPCRVRMRRHPQFVGRCYCVNALKPVLSDETRTYLKIASRSRSAITVG